MIRRRLVKILVQSVPSKFLTTDRVNEQITDRRQTEKHQGISFQARVDNFLADAVVQPSQTSFYEVLSEDLFRLACQLFEVIVFV